MCGQIGRTLFKKVCRREGIQHWPNHHGRVPADYVRRNTKQAPPSARPRPRPASFNTKRARGDFSAVEPPYQPPPANRAQTAAAAARGHSPPPPLDVAPGLAGRRLFDVGDEVMIKNPPGVFGHEQTGRITEEVLDGSQAAQVSHTGGQLFRKIGKACSETIGQYQAALAGYNLSNQQIYGRNKQFEEVRADPPILCAKNMEVHACFRSLTQRCRCVGQVARSGALNSTAGQMYTVAMHDGSEPRVCRASQLISRNPAPAPAQNGAPSSKNPWGDLMDAAAQEAAAVEAAAELLAAGMAGTGGGQPQRQPQPQQAPVQQYSPQLRQQQQQQQQQRQQQQQQQQPQHQ